MVYGGAERAQQAVHARERELPVQLADWIAGGRLGYIREYRVHGVYSSLQREVNLMSINCSSSLPRSIRRRWKLFLGNLLPCIASLEKLYTSSVMVTPTKPSPDPSAAFPSRSERRSLEENHVTSRDRTGGNTKQKRRE